MDPGCAVTVEVAGLPLEDDRVKEWRVRLRREAQREATRPAETEAEPMFGSTDVSFSSTDVSFMGDDRPVSKWATLNVDGRATIPAIPAGSHVVVLQAVVAGKSPTGPDEGPVIEMLEGIPFEALQRPGVRSLGLGKIEVPAGVLSKTFRLRPDPARLEELLKK